MVKSALRYTAALIFRIFFRADTRGRENLPKKGGFILASNHVSFLDPVALGSILPLRVSFMARHTLFRNPIFGFLITLCGAFAVRRGSADIGAIKEADRRIKSGGVLVVFPEGTRSPSVHLAAPKGGIGFLAAKSRCPVVPVFLKGTSEALPRGSAFLRLKKISIFIGKPIEVSDITDYDLIAARVMDSIHALAC